MIWRPVEKVAMLQQHPVWGLNLIGVRQERECGCKILRGTRLDKMEDTFGLEPCAWHPAAAERALAAWKTTPPCDREVFELMRELLDGAIAVTAAA